MKKITFVAQFSLYWNAGLSPVQAEEEIDTAFRSTYPAADFVRWNTEVDAAWGKSFFLTYRDEPGIDVHWVMAALYEIR